jgi:type IV secretory pathway VirB3-like protein
MVDMSRHKQPVHRSLLPREMIGGVPQAGLLILFFMGIIFIYGLRLYLTIVPIVLLYFVMRHLTKKDQWFIDIILTNIMQRDVYIP